MFDYGRGWCEIYRKVHSPPRHSTRYSVWDEKKFYIAVQIVTSNCDWRSLNCRVSCGVAYVGGDPEAWAFFTRA